MQHIQLKPSFKVKWNPETSNITQSDREFLANRTFTILEISEDGRAIISDDLAMFTVPVSELENTTWDYITEKYLKDTYYLYYVDYNDNIDKETLQKCIVDNSLYPVSEMVYECWDCPEDHETDEVEKEMIANDEGELHDDYVEHMRDWMNGNDKSDPVSDLLRNAGDQTMFYSLGIDVDGWHEEFMCPPWRGESEEDATCRINDILGIAADSNDMETLETIVAQASYGGELRIYFNASIDEVVSGGEDKRFWDGKSKDDFKSIRFKGKFAVGVINTYNGSGDFDYLTLDLTLPFMRENLFISKMEKYSLESIFGMISNWCSSDSPALMYDEIEAKVAIVPSKNSAAIAQDQEYERVFKSG